MSELTLSALMQSTGVEVEPLPRREGWQALARWRSVFSAEVKAATGKDIHLGYEWHAFSYGFSQAQEGNPALRAAQRNTPSIYLVLPAWSGADFAFRCTGPIPDLGGTRLDVIIVSDAMDWTLVYTHEPEHGPYFARR